MLLGHLNQIYLISDKLEIVLADMIEIYKIPDSLRQVLSDIGYGYGDFSEIFKIESKMG